MQGTTHLAFRSTLAGRNPTRKWVLPRLRFLKLRTLVTRRVREEKTHSRSSLPYASGYHFHRQCTTSKLALGGTTVHFESWKVILSLNAIRLL
jgi:hypothetical protein